MRSPTRVGLVVPTLNAGPWWPDFMRAVSGQSLRPDRMLVVDSASTDGTADEAAAAGFEVLRIERRTFDHGGTRQLAVNMFSDCEIIIFMTQDAILATPDSFANLVAPFSDPTVGGVCGRQLPRPGATEIESFARTFNYPERPVVRTLADVEKLGVKAAFFSNSYAAYRRSALQEIGGFPSNLIMGEDMYAAAKMLLAGWKLAYAPNAAAYHSHPYTMLEEARRYFDIGVLMAQEPWLPQRFGKTKGQGLKYVREEARYFGWRRAYLIFPAIARNFLKLLAFQCGTRHQLVPRIWARKLSMHRNFWLR